MAITVTSGTVTVVSGSNGIVTLWSSTIKGVYSAAVRFTPTSGTGQFTTYPTDGTGTIKGNAGGQLNADFAQDDLRTQYTLGPWIDPDGTSKFDLNRTTINGTSTIVWWIVQVSALT